MKKLVLLAFILVLACTSCHINKEDNKMSLDENKKISNLYHERKLEDIDKLLDDNFVGSYYQNEFKPIIWNKESHRNAITSYPNVRDSVLVQVAEGNWIAERFIRTFENEGTILKAEVMQFKQIKNGKIVNSWELFSPLDTISE